MTIEERIIASKTSIFKAVFLNTTNHYDTLFGGTAMHMMDDLLLLRQQDSADKSWLPLAVIK